MLVYEGNAKMYKMFFTHQEGWTNLMGLLKEKDEYVTRYKR